MSLNVKIQTPLTKQAISSLRAGDEVLISGAVLAARDQAHKRLCELITANQPLPVELQGAVIYYVGPTPPAAGRVIGASGPTTSTRMDDFTPILLQKGLKGTIGKGYRGPQVQKAILECGAVHFAAMGGFGALLSKHIIASELIAWEDLGTEALRKLVFEDFPVIVAYDSFGGNVYQQAAV